MTNHCTCDMPAQQKASSKREPDREQEIRASSMLIPDIIYGRYDSPQPAGRVLGIGLASLFSDWSHEIATTLMPAFLASMGVAAA